MSKFFRRVDMDLYTSIERRFVGKVWHSDDFFALSNTTYFKFMDALRWEFVAKIGFLSVARRNRWYMVTGGQKIFYRRPIRLHTSFKVDVRFVYWDDTWFYTRHIFTVDGKVAAVGYVRTLVRSDDLGTIPVQDVLSAAGLKHLPRPPISLDIQAWLSAERDVVDQHFFVIREKKRVV